MSKSGKREGAGRKEEGGKPTSADSQRLDDIARHLENEAKKNDR